ncbi:MAG TPA: tail fiber protein [Fimbriimonadaceae bacterium]|nr:tail fiber protein [Fimbriimonadaceae bacterium]
MASPYIGEIRLVGFNFAPVGWSFCDGALIPINQNEALFNLIGTTYGGDGINTFRLPDLQGRVPIHQGTSRFGSGFVIGESSGSETAALTSAEIPTHNHLLNVNSQPGTTNNPAGNIVATSPLALGNTYVTPTSITASGGATTSTGGSQAHNNVQPFLAINYIFSLFGIFPSPS